VKKKATGAKRLAPQGKPGEGGEYITCRLCLKPFRAITNSHLFRKHGHDADHPIEEYKTIHGLARSNSEDSAARRSQSKVAYDEQLGRHWTLARVASELRNREALGKALSYAAVHRERPALSIAARRLYGTYGRAIEAARIDYDRVRLRRAWNPGKVIRRIRLINREGGILSGAAMRRRDHGLLLAGVKLFGCWDAALAAAGFDPEQERGARKWTLERVIASIRAVGRPVRAHEMIRTDSGLVARARKDFGSWRRALEAAGFEYPPERSPWKWPRDRVFKEIRRRAQFGLSLQHMVIVRENGGLWKAAVRECGNWRAALEAAGIPYPGRRRWTEPGVLEEIRARAGRRESLSPGAVNRAMPGLYDAGKRIFGSWLAAVQAGTTAN
jgi:hypothetical protein